MTEFKLEENEISKHLKPLDHQVNLNHNAPFPSSNFLYLCCGGIGSGKSTIVLNLLELDKSIGGFKKAFNRIYVVSPTSNQDGKFSRLIEEVSEDGNYFDECTNDNISEIMEKIKAFNEKFVSDQEKENDKLKAKHKKPKKIEIPSSLVIIDDCADSFSKKRNNKLNKLVLTLRHLKTSVFILSQKLNAIPPIIRGQARCITFFPTLNSKEEQTLIDEINIDKALFKRLIDYCSQGEDHPFLHIKLGQGQPLFFKKFDRIMV